MNSSQSRLSDIPPMPNTCDQTPQMNNLAAKIFLYGPPLSGKSTVGRYLSDSLALPFLDLDQIIENKSGSSIPEIFAAQGEAGFRALERAELTHLLDRDWGVIALGGGALLDPQNRALVEAAGPILSLSADEGDLLDRVQSSSGDRPLLIDEDGEERTQTRLAALLSERAKHYRSIPHQIPVTNKSPQDIAWEIQVHLGAFHVSGMIPQKNKLSRLSTRPHPLGYDVRVILDSLDSLGDALQVNDLAGPVAVVSDENVADIYLSRVQKSINQAGFTSHPIVFPAGETSKTISTLSNIWQEFITARLERGSTVVALGGGVVGDLAGFAASAYMRGISWVILPTSILAMVDASLGGKTGADLPQGKNLVGAFYAPNFVLVDPRTLDSLPLDEVRSGMAEAVKAGVIADPILFGLCSLGIPGLEGRWSEVVRRAMAVKIQVIEADPYEAGIRKALNFGHTIGHAVEKVSGFTMRHGEAVSIGMVVEARLAERMGLAEHGLADEIENTLSILDLPTHIPTNLNKDSVLDAILVDKKRKGDQARFALPVRVGEVEANIVVPDLAEIEL